VNTKPLSSAFLVAIFMCGLLLVGVVGFETVPGISGISEPSAPRVYFGACRFFL